MPPELGGILNLNLRVGVHASVMDFLPAESQHTLILEPAHLVILCKSLPIGVKVGLLPVQEPCRSVKNALKYLRII